jgi:MFS family permease
MLIFRNRDIGLIVGSVGVSAFGDLLAMVPLALYVQQRTGSGLAVAGFFLALFGPIVALGGIAGLLADRFENTRLIALTSAVQAVTAAALAFVGPPALVFPLVAVLGSGAAIAAPAEFALIPAAAGEEHIAAANGYVETARYVGMTAGPLIGGLLAGAGLGRAALLLDAVSFVIVLAAALSLKARRRPARTAGAPGVAGGHDHGRGRDGLTCIARDRTLAPTLAVALGTLLFFSVSMTAELFFAKNVIRAGDAGYGLLLTGWTVGMVAGASVFARRIPSSLLATAALAAVAIQGAGLFGAALSSVLGLAVAGFALGGIAHGVKNVVLRTLIHERVPESLRGRAYSAYNAARNAAELGALVAGGVLVGAIGARAALLISGAVPLAIGAIALGLATARRSLQIQQQVQRRPQHAHPEG